MGDAVSIEDLSFTYREAREPALKNLNGHVEEGTFVVLMGHGGAGKSSLCFALNGLIPHFFRGHYEGRIRVADKEVSRFSVAQMSRHAGLVLQDFEAQLFSTNVELEMAFGPENHCIPRPEIERRVRQYLSFVGLEPMRCREPASLSGGQKQRLAIGSILALEPDLLVFDEAMTDLDPEGREEVLSLSRSIRQQGRTLLMVDHEPETALAADEVWLLREGKLLACGSPSEILKQVSLLEVCGIRPLSTIELFRSMGWPAHPLTAEAAIAWIEQNHSTEPRRLDLPKDPSPGSKGSPILQAERLGYVYPHYHIEALHEVDLSVRAGEFIAILGQNGSGKTTLAKHFNGLLKPTSGRMMVRGKATTQYSHREMAQLVGYVFQNPDHQIFSRTVKDEVGFTLKALGKDSKTISRHVEEALDVVGLQGYDERVPLALTKGERQRVAVASVLAAQPEVLILDEPTTGLDYRHQRRMMEMLRRLHRRGHTIIIITHSLWVAAEFAERTILMKDGRIVADGPTRAIFAQEEALSGASLSPPPLIRLANWLGTKALTVEGMVKELRE